jgi:hypothetical protein
MCITGIMSMRIGPGNRSFVASQNMKLMKETTGEAPDFADLRIYGRRKRDREKSNVDFLFNRATNKEAGAGFKGNVFPSEMIALKASL